VNFRHPMNESVLRFLEQLHRAENRGPDVRAPSDYRRDYWESGSHPDAVERVWDQLGRSLPAECRQVVLGSPALVEPVTGVLLALAFGTAYGVRLPPSLCSSGLPPGVRTETKWTGGRGMNIQEEFGRDWVFGAWAAEEEKWCSQVFGELREERNRPA
jgi:hypothetical protein